ncbi:HAMP domain-containing protein [Butyricicoccus sp. 1XD8-22]|nr:HAMP domain-containing protein [Butyricicoccus sp. 1XD8-22]
MRKSIKKNVWIRVAAAIGSAVLLAVVNGVGLYQVKGAQAESEAESAVLDRALKAEVAHYKWSANLSNALYEGTEFTGSKDPTTCILGQWVYGDLGTDDETILELRDKIEPLHAELHGSATEALGYNSVKAQQFYQQTIQTNLSTLVGYLDEVTERCETLKSESIANMNTAMNLMQGFAGLSCLLCLACLVSLVMYVFKHVVAPILLITERTRPLMDGKLDVALEYRADDELGDLAKTLEGSLAIIRSYVEDINRIMGQLSEGSFDVHAAEPFVGDFRSIEQSIESFTEKMSSALSQITQAEHKVSGNAEQLSSGSQALAQGATEQASAVEELFATLDDLSRNASRNVESADAAQESARKARDQVTLSSEQMEQMVAAMRDITEASQKIGEIIKTIEDIAFQTNILALNAAVEAARAGSAGKGFAVVSSEVRSLAAASDRAAKATKDLIENSVAASERGRHIVDEVSATLRTTLDLVVRSSDQIGEIAKVVQGEAVTIAQVTEGVSQVSAVVQTNSASSEESAAVSAELFEQVRLLQDQTRRFKLRQ